MKHHDSYEIASSKWDSDFFKVKTAKVWIKEKLCKEEFACILNELKAYEFAIITNMGNHPCNNEFLGSCDQMFLTDINVSMEKEVTNVVCLNKNISAPKNNFPYCEELESLAYKYIAFSKFFNDSNITEAKAREIYALWVKNSFVKKEKYFFTATSEEKIKGFVLFNTNNNICTLELIIAQKNSPNLGRDLMEKLEEYCYENKINSIQLSTQCDNYPALCLYIKHDYKLTKTSTIYHYRGDG